MINLSLPIFTFCWCEMLVFGKVPTCKSLVAKITSYSDHFLYVKSRLVMLKIIRIDLYIKCIKNTLE